MSGVAGVHSLNIWSLTMDKNVVSVHLSVGQCFITLLNHQITVLHANAKIVLSKFELFKDMNKFCVLLTLMISEEDQCGRYSEILRNAKDTISAHSDFYQITIQLEPPYPTSDSCPRALHQQSAHSDTKPVSYQSSGELAQ